MKKLKNIMDKCLSLICAVLFAGMTIIAVYQVVTRYVLNAPSSFSEELLTFCFAWMSLLAAVLVFGQRDHMRLSFFSDKIKGKNSIMLSIASEVIILIFAMLVLIYGGAAITKLTMTQVTASLQIPMGYVYSIMPISGVLTVIYSIINIGELWASMKTQQKEVL